MITIKIKNIFWYLNNKYILLCIRAITLIVFWFLTWMYSIDWSQVFADRVQTHQYSLYGILTIILIYCIRPLFRVPVAWLSVVIGTMYSFWFGLLLATLGENISATIWYIVSKYLKFRIPHRYDKYFRILDNKKTVLAVILSRLWPVPDDVNNYGWAMAGIWFWPYIVWTIIGNAVFTSINVWMWTSLNTSWSELFQNPTILLSNYQFILSTLVYIVIVITSGMSIKYLLSHWSKSH